MKSPIVKADYEPNPKIQRTVYTFPGHHRLVKWLGTWRVHARVLGFYNTYTCTKWTQDEIFL